MAVTESSNLISDFSKVLEKSFNPYEDKSLRVPMFLTSSYRKRLKIHGVSMRVNPNTVAFTQSKRITRKDTQSGAVFYHWANRSGRNNDVLDVSFSGQTGNINIRTATVMNGVYGHFRSQIQDRGPIEWLNRLSDGTTQIENEDLRVMLQGSDYAVSGAAKLASFWNLYSLTREPVVDPKTGQPVYYYISYASPLLGNSYITLIGHFNKVLDFSEVANNPYNINYSFGFTALASKPSMDYLYPTVVNNMRSLFTNPMGQNFTR